ncbi:MAG: serine hydrolase domain-containing protein [Pseudomonadota bacterium]
MSEKYEIGQGKGVHGRCMPGYEAMVDAFADTIARGLEVGAACAVFKDGIPVLDLWGGVVDRRAGTPWREDTLVTVYSVTKGVAALSILHLVDQGLLELDQPVARYWPEFAVHGKQDVTVRELLGHRAGLPFVEGEIALDELASPAHMAARLAAQAPHFAPGTTHMYHGLTIGWLTSELVRRVTGQSMGPWVAAMARRLGVELWIGLPQELRPRVALLDVQAPEQRTLLRDFYPVGSVGWKVVTLNGLVEPMPGDGGLDFNDYKLQSKELAGANLTTNARSLAKFYDSCLEQPGRQAFVSARTIADASRPVSTGVPFDSPVPGASWGAGLMIPFSVQPMLGPASFGHDGYGGSLAFADPESGVSFAYVRNQLAPGGAKDETVYRMVDGLKNILKGSA